MPAYKASPGDAGVLRRTARFHASIGDEDALALFRRAQALDPLRPNALGSLGAVLLLSGRLDEAIATLRFALVRLPDNEAARANLANALIAKGQRGEAIKVVAPLQPDAYQRLTVEAIAATDRAASDWALARLNSGTSQYQIAQIHAQRHEPDLAFAAIARAWDLGDPGLTDFKTDPLLAPLHPDPRFATWLRKIGFP